MRNIRINSFTITISISSLVFKGLIETYKLTYRLLTIKIQYTNWSPSKIRKVNSLPKEGLRIITIVINEVDFNKIAMG